jgi:Flp pilus assembly protein TadD
MAPAAPSPIILQGTAAASQRHYDEALVHFQHAAAVRRTNWVLGHLGFVLAKLGRTEKAKTVIRELDKSRANGLMPDFEIAVISAGLGDGEAAVAGLERAAAAYSPSMLWANVDYRLADLHTHPRFPALLASLGLTPQQH